MAAGCQPAASAAPTTTVASGPPTAAPTLAASPAPASVASEEILFTVSVTGGGCPDGPCGAEYVVHGDGLIERPGGRQASIAPAQLARITSLAAATDWVAVRAVPYASTCPTAYDGQKHVYAFTARGGDIVLDSCEFDLSQVPVIQAIDEALFAG